MKLVSLLLLAACLALVGCQPSDTSTTPAAPDTNAVPPTTK